MKKIIFILGIFIFLFCNALFAVDFYEITRSTVGNSTLSEIRDLVRERIDDPETSYGNTRYSNAFINSLINMAQRDISINTQCLWSSCTGQVTQDVAEYDLLNNIWAIDRVVWNDDWVLKPKSIYDMDNSTIDWFDTTTSSSTIYYWYRGQRQIYFYPTPEYSGGTIQIWYIKLPDDMTADSEEIFDSDVTLEAFKDALVVYSMAKIYFFEGDTRASTSFQEYLAYLDMIRKNHNITPDYKPSLTVWGD